MAETARQPSKDARHCITPKARLNYAHIFAPKSGPNGEEPSYSCVLVFDPGTDLAGLKNAAWAAAKEKWGDKARQMQLRNPFRNNADKQGQEGFPAGGVFITCRTKNKPGLVDQSTQPIMDNNGLYSGCWVRASIRAFTYDNKGNKGISFALLNIQKMGDGDRLDNRRSPDQDFEPLPGSDPFDDSSSGDGLPF